MPESVIVLGEPGAVLVTVTVPVSLPAVAGLKITLNVMLCPTTRVSGVPDPLSVNPAPLSAICDIVTFVLPEFFTVTLWVDDVPVLTFPKLRLEVLNESACNAATPVPLKAMAAEEFGALLTTVTLPLSVAADGGSNCTLKLAD